MPVPGEFVDPGLRVDALIVEYDRDGDESRLVEAERMVRGFLAAEPERVDWLLALSTVLLRRGRLAGDDTFLESAAALAERADALTERDGNTDVRPLMLAQLAWVATARYEVGHRPADITAAVRYAAAALAAVEAGAEKGEPDAMQGEVLVRCITAYQMSFQRFGRLVEIDTAVRLARRLGRSSDPEFVSTARNFLAACLGLRYARTGDRADVDEAIAHCRTGLAGLPRRHVDRMPLQSALAFALMQRWMRTDGATEDLLDAVRISRALVADLPRGESARAQLLANHAALLFVQALEGRSPRHLEEAVRRAREAVASQGEGASQASHLANLANVLLAQARLGSDPDGVRTAVDIGKQALAHLSPGNPDRARALNILGSALRIRYLIDRDPADLDAAVGMWRSAAGSPVGPIEIRMTAARKWAETAAEEGDGALALEAHTVAVELLPLLAWRGLDRGVQEKRLATASGLAGEAAAWAIASGRPERAVELLEQGRQVLWSQAVQTRSDLSALAAVAPRLAAELDEVRRELDGAEIADISVHAGGLPAFSTGDTGRRRRLVERWDQLLSDVRRKQGFEGFLSPAAFDVLRHAGAGGAVVLVSTSRYRSDALIVTAGEVHHVPLPWLAHDAAQKRAAALLAAQHEVESGGGAVAGAALRQTLVAVQRWLWDTVGEPVCTALDGLFPQVERHRVWWCPAGPLTMLPLHAAGRFGARPRSSVAARCVSSYTPSLSALLRARVAVSGPPRAFAVGVAALPGQAALPSVSEELRAVSSHVPGLRILSGRGATVAAVLAALDEHGWAHFACHGTQDFERPSAGALRLVDGRLSVLDLAGRSGAAGDLAYLSACRTAAGGRDLPDEAIHLTAALQLAGFRHVIGSQWAVSDRVAAQVAGDVYASLTAGGALDASGAALALDRAIDRVRTERPDRPDLWAALIHTGP
ncbi:CHAT domain-containing protein [Actinoplanes sp. NPDC051851]|uniref:CHAT domain-containing protein n=1 Tax=Actinoplanes sp. NPDC051851 TaxID=3154753 RepID=UPI0034167513